MERNPVDLLARRLPELLADVRRRLGAYVGAQEGELVLVPNATSALNVVARSLDLRPGDEVLATDHEYGAANLLWEFVCRRASAAYVQRSVPVPISSVDDVVEAVWAGVTERTRVLFVSHVTSSTAIVFPVAELCRRARERGILVVVDGAHAPGHVPLDLASLGADAYAGNCHKWLCAPKGAGFLWVRPELQERVDSLVIGWGWAEDDATFLQRNEAQGTRDPAAYLAIGAALDLFEEWSWCEVRAVCHDIASQARGSLAALTGLDPLQPDSPDWFGQMVAAELPGGCDAAALGLRLAHDHGIEVSAQSWNGTPLIRVSVQGYNTPDDVDRLLTALPTAIPA